MATTLTLDEIHATREVESENEPRRRNFELELQVDQQWGWKSDTEVFRVQRRADSGNRNNLTDDFDWVQKVTARRQLDPSSGSAKSGSKLKSTKTPTVKSEKSVKSAKTPSVKSLKSEKTKSVKSQKTKSVKSEKTKSVKSEKSVKSCKSSSSSCQPVNCLLELGDIADIIYTITTA